MALKIDAKCEGKLTCFSNDEFDTFDTCSAESFFLRYKNFLRKLSV